MDTTMGVVSRKVTELTKYVIQASHLDSATERRVVVVRDPQGTHLIGPVTIVTQGVAKGWAMIVTDRGNHAPNSCQRRQYKDNVEIVYARAGRP